ncbi:MAG: diadenylate cyclase CdaA [Alphaproteobacteria bacterium]|nr:diadenylate cyclase CdaA [Alphaproteobacteria bacterium]
MDSVRMWLQNYLGVSGLTGASILFQFAIIIGVLYFFYARLIKDTPVEKTVKGILYFLILLWVVSEVFSVLRLRILSTMLHNLILLIILSFMVIFQPELRRFMARLGNSIEALPQAHKHQLNNKMIDVLVQSITYWQQHKTGALLVFENQEPVSAVTTGGTTLNAVLSSELLINLFFINTPLHDGAVVIKNNQVLKAGVILPLSHDATLNWKYGTRHRAAIGMSESTDCLVIVVSEETGDISFIKDGHIDTFHLLDKLPERLNQFLRPILKKPKTEKLWMRIKELIKLDLSGK